MSDIYAFPCPAVPIPENMRDMYYGEPGMGLRDYFAARALQALITKIPLHDRTGQLGSSNTHGQDIHDLRRDVAASAYDYADAMLEVRTK